MKLRLGDQIWVRSKLVRRRRSSMERNNVYQYRHNWEDTPITPVLGIVYGVRVLSNGNTEEGQFCFDQQFKAYYVAINLKQIIKVRADGCDY